MPSYAAATHFSRIPPTGSTLPLKVISPVIERLSRTGTFIKSETKHVTIVTPAEGPSFFCAPAGKWRCKDIFSNSSICYVICNASDPPHKVKSDLLALIHDKAMLILSFITSPSCPVTYILNFELGYLIASTIKIFPPIGLHAIPLTTPIPFQRSSFL